MASKKSKTAHIDRYNAGVVFYNKGDFSKAITEFRAALSADSKNQRYAHALANAYNNRGVARYEKKEYESAASDFRKAREHDKQNEHYTENLKLAEESAHKSKVDADCKGAYKAFGKKRYSVAIKMLRDALKKESKDKEIIQALAVAYNARGVENYEKQKFGAAIKDFELAYKIHPEEKQYKLNISWTKEAEKRASKKKR